MTRCPPRAPALAHTPAQCLCAFTLHFDPRTCAPPLTTSCCHQLIFALPTSAPRASAPLTRPHRAARRPRSDRRRVARCVGREARTLARSRMHAPAPPIPRQTGSLPMSDPRGRAATGVQNLDASWSFETLPRRCARDCRGWCSTTVCRTEVVVVPPRRADDPRTPPLCLYILSLSLPSLQRYLRSIIIWASSAPLRAPSSRPSSTFGAALPRPSPPPWRASVSSPSRPPPPDPARRSRLLDSRVTQRVARLFQR
jgi:hypothetical protein